MLTHDPKYKDYHSICIPLDTYQQFQEIALSWDISTRTLMDAILDYASRHVSDIEPLLKRHAKMAHEPWNYPPYTKNDIHIKVK